MMSAFASLAFDVKSVGESPLPESSAATSGLFPQTPKTVHPFLVRFVHTDNKTFDSR